MTHDTTVRVLRAATLLFACIALLLVAINQHSIERRVTALEQAQPAFHADWVE